MTRPTGPAYHEAMKRTLSEYGYLRAAAAVPLVKPGDVPFNCKKTQILMEEAARTDVSVTVFPELGITGYTCGDLFQQERLLHTSENGVMDLISLTKSISGIFVLGAPVKRNGRLFNCALVIGGGRLHGVVPKTIIPTYREFYEARWFSSGGRIKGEIEYAGFLVPMGTDCVFSFETDGEQSLKASFGIEICEDLWAPVPPSAGLCSAGAQIILNPSASNELVGKASYRHDLITQQSARCLAGYIYASAGVGESTTDTVFGGHAIIAENGAIITEAERFQRHGQIICSDIDLDFLEHERINSTTFAQGAELETREYRCINLDLSTASPEISSLTRTPVSNPFVPDAEKDLEARCREIFAIQSAGLAGRLGHIGCKNVVLGLSGGLDSTLALLVTVEAFRELDLDLQGIRTFTLPGFGTSSRTRGNVEKLTRALGVPLETVEIGESCLLQLKDLKHSGKPEDTAYENVQARQRTMFLMNKANMLGAIVIGTGDLSELALGWCTYNGDHMSMYSVNSGVPKTLVRFLVTYAANSRAGEEAAAVLHDIVDTPISPELLPPDAKGEIAQKTEDTIGPYVLHDFFLYHAIRCGASPKKVLLLAEKAFSGEYATETILSWLRSFYRRFFSQQFKRSCLSDGPKVGTISLSPRGDWRMPSDADAGIWLNELDEFS
ncbi:NAD(+) synthase [Marispirochaeta sp.]|uniref:NAD(+) synthase n=1 Tax=Marispirochaeta sp. TaxID=2038653 RepID=UPI0029C84F12|nr:NAD(+) synthase [Marispirochaeta sp.]